MLTRCTTGFSVFSSSTCALDCTVWVVSPPGCGRCGKKMRKRMPSGLQMVVLLFLNLLKTKILLVLSGVNCELRDLCASQPCQNSGRCVSMNAGFTCKCLPGFHGPTCSSDVDECSINRTICLNSGTCQNLHGSYRYCNFIVL